MSGPVGLLSERRRPHDAHRGARLRDTGRPPSVPFRFDESTGVDPSSRSTAEPTPSRGGRAHRLRPCGESDRRISFGDAQGAILGLRGGVTVRHGRRDRLFNGWTAPQGDYGDLTVATRFSPGPFGPLGDLSLPPPGGFHVELRDGDASAAGLDGLLFVPNDPSSSPSSAAPRTRNSTSPEVQKTSPSARSSPTGGAARGLLLSNQSGLTTPACPWVPFRCKFPPGTSFPRTTQARPRPSPGRG